MPRLAVLAAVLMSAFASAVAAQSTYTGPEGGDWNVAANWTPTGVPNSASAQVVLAGSNSIDHSVDLNGASVTVNRIDSPGLGESGQWSIANGTLHLAGANAGFRTERWNSQLNAATLPAVVLDVSATIDVAFLYGSENILGGLGGSGTLTKSGTGILVLSGLSSLTGMIDVTQGTLFVPAGAQVSNALTRVTASAALIPAGSLSDVELQAGSTLNLVGGILIPVSTSATMNAHDLLWHGGATINFRLDGSGGPNRIALNGTLSKGSAGTYEFYLDRSGLQPGSDVTLIAFSASSGFSASDFSYALSGPPSTAGSGHFVLTATELRFVVDSAPVSLQSFTVE